MSFELRASDGSFVSLTGELVRVGRAADNTVVLNDPALSRYHLNFYVQNGALIAEDAGSQNGFTVNGQPMQGAARLNVGDRIGFGSREYLVQPAGAAYNQLNLASDSAPRTSARPSAPGLSRFPGSPSFARDEGMSGRNKIYLVLAGLIIAGALFVKKQEDKIKREVASSTPPVANADLPEALPFDTKNEKFRQKAISEVQAEAKFRESLRDYYNKNYSRAILGFRETLSINSYHAEAANHLRSSEDLLDLQIQELIEDTKKSLANMQHGRAKSQSMRVLTLIAEQIPSYNRVIAQEAAREVLPRVKTQDENLLTIPCEKYKTPAICSEALKYLKEARQQLGDEDTLKEVR